MTAEPQLPGGAKRFIGVQGCQRASGLEGTLADGVVFERRLFHTLFATEGQKEGMDAFLNKRKAQFRQR